MGQSKGIRPESSGHYRWVIVVAGICGLFASLGIGRFALGMLLPGMGEALDLSYGEMGMIGTLNFCGYLSAVQFCGRLTSFFGSRVLISMALVLVGGSMILIGFVEIPSFVMALYFLTGIGSALSNVPIMALISSWFSPAYRGRAAGFVVIGNGLGIVLAGYLVPRLNGEKLGWQSGWITLGVLVLGAALICWVLIRNNPDSSAMAAQTKKQSADSNENETNRISAPKRFEPIFAHCAALYFLFGFTYVIYATFFVTSLVQERGFSEQYAGMLWSWLGVLSLISGPVFGYLSDRFGRKAGLVTVFTIQTAAYLCAVTSLPELFVYISIFCFGIVAWSIPSIMAALVGDVAGPERAAGIFGAVTFVFGIGQISGPFFSGILAERFGGFTTSFGLAAGFGAVAIVLSALLPKNIKQR